MGHTHRCQLALKKKKSPIPESCVPETGSDPPIGSGRDSGRDNSGLGSNTRMSFLHTNDLSDVKNGEFGLDFKVWLKTVRFWGFKT